MFFTRWCSSSKTIRCSFSAVSSSEALFNSCSKRKRKFSFSFVSRISSSLQRIGFGRRQRRNFTVMLERQNLPAPGGFKCPAHRCGIHGGLLRRPFRVFGFDNRFALAVAAGTHSRAKSRRLGGPSSQNRNSANEPLCQAECKVALTPPSYAGWGGSLTLQLAERFQTRLRRCRRANR